jgi:hypothetical protein
MSCSSSNDQVQPSSQNGQLHPTSFSIPSSAPETHHDNYIHSSITQNNAQSSSQNPSNSSCTNNLLDVPLFPMLVNAINGSTSSSDITDSQSVIQFDGSDFLMLDDAVESSNAHHDISEGDEPSGRAGIRPSFSSAHHARAKAKVSWVWTHFKSIPGNETNMLCLLCNKEVYYTFTQSTGMLERHVKRKHPKGFLEAIKSGMKKSSIEVKPVHSQRNMEDYVISFPTFAQCLVDWVIATYQPL